MNIQVLSDQHLLNNYRSGDQSAISKLIERHKRRVRDYIYMMVKDNGSLRFAEKTIEDELISSQIESDVRNLIELLPEEQREVVMMRYYSGMSFKEIAEQTGVSINTALGRMRYALINLRRMIREKELILS